MNGFLLIDKPPGWTSFQVVARVKKITGASKAGHCGTLDPLATGLMIIGLGKATILHQFLLTETKSYETVIRLGYRSTTYDRDGELTAVVSPAGISLEAVQEALARFQGEIVQTAPAYSALKYRGKPLYHYARAQKPVPEKVRNVKVEQIDLLEYTPPFLKLSIDCSKGTYIRSIAHDLGELLGCGGYVEELRRTRLGTHDVKEALSVGEIESLMQSGRLEIVLRPIDAMVTFPSITLSGEKVNQVRNGISIGAKDIAPVVAPIAKGVVVALRDNLGRLLAIGKTLYATDQYVGLNGARVIEYLRVI